MGSIPSRASLPGRFVCLVLLALVIVLGAVMTASAIGPSEPATITGFVHSPDGSPLEGIYVRASGETSDAAMYGFEQSGITDASGRFVITDIIQGTYSLYINDPNSPNDLHDVNWAENSAWALDEVYYPPNYDTRRHILGGTSADAGNTVLDRNGTLSGRAVDGAIGVGGSDVVAQVTTNSVVYTRWATTDMDGNFTIPDAIPGEWSLYLRGTKSGKVPDDAVPSSSGYSQDYDPITQSEEVTCGLVSGEDVNLPNVEFNSGHAVVAACTEASADFGGDEFQVAGISVIAYPTGGDPNNWETNFSWQVDETGFGHTWLPAGSWDYIYRDGSDTPVYEDTVASTVVATVGGSSNLKQTLTPKADSYAVWGTLQHDDGGGNAKAWITASFIDPDSGYPEFFRRVTSWGDGPGGGAYLIRVPTSTGLTDNQVLIKISDKADPLDPNDPVPFQHPAQEGTFNPAGTHVWNVERVDGGSITGRVVDEAGLEVPGVTVSAARKAFDPSFGSIAWTGSDEWTAFTDVNGEYTLSGMPSNADYKVNFYPDYNPPAEGYDLPIQYRDYNRRTYKNQPLVDSLNTSSGATVVDHTAVPVTLGATTASIDETIVPGGYVALHADGPSYPTGAVWVDVWYQYKTKWFEIDSGYTTGGTFQKIWKVLPTGTYRVDYTDYFGRGAGSWSFELAPWEKKYTSVLVPAPSSFAPTMGPAALAPASLAPAALSTNQSKLRASFLGVVGGGAGLEDGGAGGARLTFQPAPLIHLPSGYWLAGDTAGAKSTGTAVDGVWAITLPYNTAVPNSEVPYLRVLRRNPSARGGIDSLKVIGWDTKNHTVMFQTKLLTSFRVAYTRHKVALGTPVAASRWKRYSRHTVYGTIAPYHSSGSKSARFMVYKKSGSRYVWYKNVTGVNYNLRSGTRYKATFSLPKGTYRIYGYAPSDKWHLSTKSTGYDTVSVY
ncbi:MAG: carboxypeptidase regulatory-like domain-containing protein [Coriobacteriia bacterium]|nr:carboxypeptidase regulatory-like domain-containing protein [Coriobacteriia bacterium]